MEGASQPFSMRCGYTGEGQRGLGRNVSLAAQRAVYAGPNSEGTRKCLPAGRAQGRAWRWARGVL